MANRGVHGLTYDWVVESNYHALEITSTRVSLEDLSMLYRTWMTHAHAIMGELMEGYVCRVSLDEVVHDDLASRTKGYSFLMDPRNALKSHMTALGCHIRESQALSAKYTIPGEDMPNVQAVSKWISRAVELNELLYVLIHLTSGLPGRSTEEETYKILNTAESSRGLYFNQGSLYVMTGYWKGQNITGKSQTVARFLPRPVADCLFTYLLVVRPLQVVWSGALGREQAARALRTYLFVGEGGTWRDGSLRNLWHKHYGKCIPGRTLAFGAFRHVVQAFMKKHVVENPRKAEMLYPMAKAVAMQGSHSMSTAARLYAQLSEERGVELTADQR